MCNEILDEATCYEIGFGISRINKVLRTSPFACGVQLFETHKKPVSFVTPEHVVSDSFRSICRRMHSPSFGLNTSAFSRCGRSASMLRKQQ